MDTDPEYAAEFTAVFERRHAELFRYLDRLTGDAALAADIAQETFVRLYERGAIPENERGWLAAVANNLFRDDRRRSSRRERLLELQSAADPQYQDPREPMDSDDEERRQEARRALEALTPRERQLLLLRHEGYSYRELSVALRIVETSIGTLLARAKVSFRAALEGVGHAPT